MNQTALYARVSSARQEKEETIESQIEQLLRYAQEQGYEIPVALRFIDEAISGERLARPGLDRLRDAAAAGAFQCLLCLSIDRMARNLGAQHVVLNELERSGVEVIFLNQPDLGKGPEAKLLLNIQGAFAEYERVLIRERMRRGRLYRLRHGLSVPPAAPYGYRYQPATGPGCPAQWVVVPEEAAVVQQLFAWYNEKQGTLGQLAQRLNAQGTPSPAGKRWLASAIGRLLRQPAYKGTAYYNRRRADYQAVGQRRRQGTGRLRFPRYVSRPLEEWIAVCVPEIVDEHTWQIAQEQLRMNARFASRNSHRPYLLRSLLVCGTCGHLLQGRTQRGQSYYRCLYGSKHRAPGVARHTCSVRGDVVETHIWTALADLLRQPQQVRQAWEALHAEQTTPPEEAHRWQQRQQQLDKQRKRLLDAYQVGVLELDELITRRNTLEVELQALQRQIKTVSREQETTISLETFTQRIEQALAASDFETRQEVIRLLIERIVVTDEALTVEYIVPTVNNGRLHPTRRVACCVLRITHHVLPDT